MSHSDLTCPKCDGEMERGCLHESSWVKGQPTIPALVKALSWNIFTLPGEKRYVPVATFRCQSCGFLESYAREEFEPK